MAGAEQVLARGVMPREISLLIVDDDRNSRESCKSVAENLGFTVFIAEDAAGLLRHLAIHKTDLVLLESRVAGPEPHSLLRSIRQIYLNTEVIMMSGQTTVESVLTAMKTGASDYLRKPFHMEELRILLEKTAVRLRTSPAEDAIRDQFVNAPGYTGMIGQSPEMLKVLRIISRVASSKHPVLIMGESGTGKHMLARAIHESGVFRDRPFVAVDCATTAPAILEADLFGFVKGGFNGSGKAKEGLIQSANGGTLFLHDVNTLTMDIQSKLLRAFQEREIKQLGSNKAVPLDVRVIASTSQEMESLIQQGTFRRDLFFRLNVVNLRLPALRERKQDIPLIAEVILRRISAEKGITYSLSSEVMKAILTYEWPQNVRELENCLERAAATANGSVLNIADLPPQVQTAKLRSLPNGTLHNRIVPLAEIEKHAIISTLQQLNGDKQMAARLLGIGKTTLYRKLREYGIAETLVPNQIMPSKSA